MFNRSRYKCALYVLFLIGLLVGFPFPHRQTVVAQQTWSLPAPWSAQDIGNPALAGTAAFNQGTFSIDAAGSDIGGQSDQFTFIYQQVTGDVDVIARVDSVSATDAWSKTGVMIRNSLAPDAAHGYALVSAGSGVAFQRRRNDGGSSTTTNGPSVSAPYWVRLVRQGTTVTAYSSANGSNWSTLTSRTVTLASTVYVGIATTSHNASAITSAAVSQVSVNQQTQQSQQSPPPPQSLPAPQKAADIGAPSIAGSTSYSQGVYSIHAGGADIWGTSDQFHFVYQPMTGDGEVVARVRSLSNTDTWAKTGVMIRETLTADSRHAFAMVSAGAGYAFQRRIDPAGISEHTAGPAGAAPGWVRLVRTASRFEAFTSTDGSTWTSIGSDTIPMADAVYVGIATTSHNTSTATDAVVDNFLFKAGTTSTQTPPANQPPTVSLTAPANGSTFTAPASVTLTASAADADGTIAKVEFYNGTTLLNTDTTAPYAYTWSSVAAGSYALRAVAYDSAGASASSATVNVTVGSGTSNGLVGAYSLDEGTGTTAGDSSGAGTAGTITNATWTAGRYGHGLSFAGNGEVDVTDVDLPGSFTVMGWMQTRSLYTGTCGSFVMKVHDYGFEMCDGRLYAGVGANDAWTPRASIALTSADLNTWKHAAFTYDGTTVRLYIDGALISTATGAHTTTNNPLVLARYLPASEYWDGLIDEVRLYNRILSQTEIQSAMNTPIGGATTGNKTPTATLTSPTTGATFTAPASVTMSASASDADGTIAKVEFYNGTTLLNTDTAAPYTYTWSSVAAGTYSVKAVAYDNNGASGSSSTASITINGANKAPTVTLSSPTTGSTFTAPASVTMSASAGDTDGTIAKVEFYNGTTLLNTDTAAPYTYTWSSVAAGTYTLKAVAYDNSGASTSSATSTITVSTVVTTPPTGVAFTASADHATLVTRYELRIYAPGANPNTATPIATSDLGKPTPDANNNITVDRSAFFSALGVGNYVAAVAAIGSGGSSISTGVTFTR